jgi:hypothetical protein
VPKVSGTDDERICRSRILTASTIAPLRLVDRSRDLKPLKRSDAPRAIVTAAIAHPSSRLDENMWSWRRQRASGRRTVRSAGHIEGRRGGSRVLMDRPDYS